MRLSENKISTLADRILTKKQKDPDADTSALERQIDQMVYKLYELTEEEIRGVLGRSFLRIFAIIKDRDCLQHPDKQAPLDRQVHYLRRSTK